MATRREIPGGEPPHPLRHLASLRRGAPVAGLDAQVRQVFRRRGERPRQTGHWWKLVSGGREWLRSWRVVLDHVSAEAGLLFDRRRACRRRGLGRRGWFVPRLHLSRPDHDHDQARDDETRSNYRREVNAGPFRINYLGPPLSSFGAGCSAPSRPGAPGRSAPRTAAPAPCARAEPRRARPGSFQGEGEVGGARPNPDPNPNLAHGVDVEAVHPLE